MKRLAPWLSVLFVLLFLSVPALGFKPTQVNRVAKSSRNSRPAIEINEFVPNNYISGRIVGIPSSDYGRYKIIAYVRTDRWYLHPYERGGEGLSFASVSRKGEWRINTIKRKIPADKVAFFLVEKDYVPPAEASDTSVVRYRLVHVEEGRGRI